MNLVKRSMLVALIVLAQFQNVFSFTIFDEEVSTSKAFVCGAVAVPALMALRVFYKNYNVDSKLKDLRDITKSLNNSKINPGDTSEDIANKWGMKGWRLKGAGFNHLPEQTIPDAHFIYLNEPLVVECLYNDLKFRDIYLIHKREMFRADFYELLPFTFVKPEISAYKDERVQKDGQCKPLTVKDVDEVPSITTLKDLHTTIENEIKVLREELDKLNKAANLDESLEDLLIKACDGRRNATYQMYIDEKIEEIKKKKLPQTYECNLVKMLQQFKTTPIDDISDLYLFDEDLLYKDYRSTRTGSLQTMFIQLCKDEESGKNKPESSGLTGVLRKPFDLLKGVVVDLNDNYSGFKKVTETGREIFTFSGEKADELLEQRCITYLQVAVNYARLVKLAKVVSKIISMSNGYENILSLEEQIKKDKAKVTKKVADVIKMVKELEVNKKVSYIVLDKIQDSIQCFQISFVGFELVKLYGSVKIKTLLSSMLKKMSNDVKTLSTYLSPNVAQKNDDDDEFGLFGGGFGQRAPAGKSNIYADGMLNDAGLQSLRAFCTAWLVGLEEIDKLSKL
ncbi:MAG: hypothetical protein P4L22_05100 [Candidatus Babeliales bacterium]|nr:hypothetical protein [Candidatus Babeliales bacterium]